jgi:hypothetical protein
VVNAEKWSTGKKEQAQKCQVLALNLTENFENHFAFL